MSPPGHAAAAYLLGRAVRWISLPAIVIGGVLPDVDFVFLPFSWFNQYHRVITHNIWFVLLAALIGVLFVKADRRMPVLIGMLCGGLLHLLIDACMDSNPSNGIGVAIFWPFSNYFFSPFNLVRVSESGPNWNDPWALGMAFLRRGMIWELPLWLLAMGLWWKSRTRHQTPETSAPN